MQKRWILMRPMRLTGKTLWRFQRRHGCCAVANFFDFKFVVLFLCLVVCSWFCGLTAFNRSCKELMLLRRSLCRKNLRRPRPYIYIYTYIYICFVLLLFCNTLCVCLAYSFNKQVALEPPEIPAVTPFSKIQLAAHKRLQAAEQNGKGAQTKRKGTGKGGKDTQKKTKENKAGRSVLCTF